MRKRTTLLSALGLMVFASYAVSAAPKNVILMISDGWGYNAISATNAYLGTTASYQNNDFVAFAMKTNSANNPAGYDPYAAWESNGLGGLKPDQDYFKAGNGATDSASAITAMMTGNKNYDGTLNWSTSGQKMNTFADNYKAVGAAIGSISTVQWSHATPAGVLAHNSSRNNYAAIANEAISSDFDVIMGAGNPEYNDNGTPATKDAKYVGGDTTWTALKNGTAGGANPWTLIQDRTAFQNLATGATPNRVVGTFKANSTAQQARTGDGQVVDLAGLNPNVPTLSEMSLGALNVLDNNQAGFFLMVEGGAIDWANHGNQKGRLIEEQLDFNNAVDAVIGYVNANSNWQDTLLIITGDHECGFLLGPNGETSIVDNGVGNMPGMKYFSGDHSNQLIPLFAKGAGSELFAGYAVGNDPVRGKYIDNTDIFKVMSTAAPVPEPSSIIALVAGLTGMAGVASRRRNK